MSFLAPWFLLGALAVAGPVLFHLMRRTTRERVSFSSLLFLRPVPPRLTRRNRLEHLLLLALRCLAITLLAAGFARPYWRQLFPAAAAEDATRRTVLLVDTSASLRRGDLWAQALARAEAVLHRAAPGDQVAVLTFDREVVPRLSLEDWAATPVGERTALARARLAAVQPGWAATHLDTALIRAAEQAAEAAEGPADGVREVIVVSDLHQGSRTTALQGHEWPRGVTVRFEPLRPPATANAALHWVPEPDAAASAETAGTVRVRVVNAPDSRREQFKLRWVDSTGTNPAPTPLEVYVPPGQSRVVALTPPTHTPPVGMVRLEGDEESFDNLAHVAPPQPQPLRVIYLGHDAPGDSRSPRFFLERAFPPTPRRAVQVRAPDPTNPPAAELESAALAVVTVPLSPGLGAVLRPLLARGRTVLWVPPDAAAVAGVDELIPGTSLAAEDHRPADYALLTEPDYRHPLLAPFAGPRFGDFSKIRFWQHRRLGLAGCPEARVLARFDSGDPALVEIPAGHGRVQVWASGWAPADSQLALSTKFVPLLHGLLDLSAGPPPGATQYVVGDALPLPAALPAASVWVMKQPDGTTRLVAAGTERFETTSQPGLYELTAGEQVFRWAVNLDPAESRLTPLPVEDFERLGVPLRRPELPPAVVAARLRQLQAAELEGRQQLWRWLLLGTLGVLGLETVLAGRAVRRRAVFSEVSP